MPANVIPFGNARSGATSIAEWSLLEIALPGFPPTPLGVMLADKSADRLFVRLRSWTDVEALIGCDLDEQERDVLEFLGQDLEAKAGEGGAAAVFESLEDTLSSFLRIGGRAEVACGLGPRRETDRLFDLHVDGRIGRFKTHLPFYELQAAATKFGESFANAARAESSAGTSSNALGEPGGAEWIRIPDGFRVSPDMFAARVVGRSMEPRIPDGSVCAFRYGVAGSRQGRLLLVELFDETDYASRYTVKKYSSRKVVSDVEDDWAHASVRLEPLNREFDGFELSPDRFRVVAEFVSVLGD